MTATATAQQDLLSESVNCILTRWRAELTASGETLLEQSGAAPCAANGASLSIESVYGPVEQAKTTNQDAALLWVPAGSRRIRWAVAVADGLSRSLYAGLASRLACHAALTTLRRCDAQGLRLRSIYPCVRFFQRLGETVQAEPERHQPTDCFPATWSRVLRDGRFLQTTLTVVWATDSQIHLASLGDGGVVLKYGDSQTPIALVPHSDRAVNCLGPSPPVRPLDLELSVPTDRCRSLCVFTDGVSPIMRTNPEFAIQVLARSSTRGRRNAAADVIRFLAYSGIDPAADNLTLFAMTGAS